MSTKNTSLAVTRTLPPDPDGQNDQRSERAAAALKTFMDKTVSELPEAVDDLLADIMHYCDRNGIDFAEALASGRMHYECETGANEDEAFARLEATLAV